jgi:hypothetical protein
MSPRSLVPDSWVPLEQALRERRPVRLSYHGRRRIVSPHALGWSKDRLVLLGYQSATRDAAGACADPRTRWRCMFVDEVEDVVPAEESDDWQSAANYDPEHPFSAIDAVIVAVELAGGGA